MEVQQLRHLLAAVQYGNLVKASEECAISQSGLSRSIKSLETRLGVPVLVRSSSGVTPTVYGLSILERARVILNEVSRSVEEIREVKAGRSGLVTIGVTHNFAHNLMPSVLMDLAASGSSVSMHVTAAAFPVIVDMVKAGEIDLGFGLLSQLENTAGLDIEEIGGSHARVVARPSHPLANIPAVTVSQLASARWALLDSRSLQTKFASFFKARGRLAPTQVVKTNSVVFLKKVMTQSDLVSVLPIDMIREDLQSGTLVAIDAEPPSEFAQAGLVLRENTYISPAIQSVINGIRRHASDGVDDEFIYAPQRPKETGSALGLGVAAE